MQLGLIGLGKMGGNMAERVRRAGHEVVGYDSAPGKRDVDSLEGLVQALTAPRVVWVMVPAGEPTRSTVRRLGELLEPGDVVVDGGNSKFTDDQLHAEELGAKSIGYVDCGVSGGVWGLENGYALMVGGSKDDVAKVQPIFDALRPQAPQDASGQEMPKSSQPPPEDFRAAYAALAGQGVTDIISVHVTAKASGTYRSAEMAKELVPNVNVHVVDSATTSMHMGFMLLAAAEVVEKGGGVPEALAAIEQVKAGKPALIDTITQHTG